MSLYPLNYWSTVAQFLDELPTPWQPQALNLRMALLLKYTDSGLLQDLCHRDFDYPWLALPAWVSPTQSAISLATPIEQPVFEAMFYTLAATFLAESIADVDGTFDEAYAPLQTLLVETARARWAQACPPTEAVWQPFWEHYQNSWAAYQRAQTAPLTSPQLFTEQNLSVAAGRFAPASLGLVGLALARGQAAQLPQWLTWQQELNLVYALHQDILTAQRDLWRGHYTYPIVYAMQVANLPLGMPPDRQTVLGAMLLTNAVPQLIQTSLDRLAQCRALATDLNLPAWCAYSERYAAVLQELQHFFRQVLMPAVTPATQSPRIPRRPMFALATDGLARAIERAEKHLLADLTFAESWEVQRLLSPTRPDYVSRAFPMGTILECLCAHGVSLVPQVDQVFKILQDNRYTYYEDIAPLPDSDDYALLLRLFRFSSQKAEQRQTIERGLPWLAANVTTTGEISVFWKHSTDAPPPDMMGGFGNRCVTTTTNTLRGLLVYDYIGQQALVEKISHTLATRLVHFGLGPLTYYLPPYAVWSAFDWLTRLQAQPISGSLRAALVAAQPSLLARLAREKAYFEASPSLATPQTVACFTLSCLGHAGAALFDPAWLTLLLKRQRYDGSWEAEPFFLTLHHPPGYPVWYGSRLVTTALCYHALQTYREHYA